MRTVLRRGNQEFELLRWPDLSSLPTVIPFHDPLAAYVFLGSFMTNTIAMHALRHAVAQEEAFDAVSRMTDHAILDYIARALVLGHFTIATRQAMPHGGGAPRAAGPPTEVEEPETATPSRPQPARDTAPAAREAAPVVEEAPIAAVAVAQAATLKQAARAGTPCCVP